MIEETNRIRRKIRQKGPIDAVDRKILGVLVEDSGMPYAQIGKAADLSAPAVHERVKRMREDGVIRGTAAQLSPGLIGKPLLAFVMITIEGNERKTCWRDSNAYRRSKRSMPSQATAA